MPTFLHLDNEDMDEKPSGKGTADVAFIPTPLSRLPAMVVETEMEHDSRRCDFADKREEMHCATETLSRETPPCRDQL